MLLRCKNDGSRDISMENGIRLIAINVFLARC
jgi:hypothetical protein